MAFKIKSADSIYPGWAMKLISTLHDKTPKNKPARLFFVPVVLAIAGLIMYKCHSFRGQL